METELPLPRGQQRLALDVIMKDQWVNIGYEDDRLKPYSEPPLSLDQRRIEVMVTMGYTRRDIEDSLTECPPPIFRPMSIVAKRSPIPATAKHLLIRLRQVRPGTFVHICRH